MAISAFDGQVHPELRAAFSRLVPPDDDVLSWRAQVAGAVARLNASGVLRSDVVTGDVVITAASDRRPVRLRVHRFRDSPDAAPALVWVHGGGFQTGLPEMDDQFCTRVAAAIEGTVVAPDYRLAPEHPYPAALDDCSEAVAWTVERGCPGAGRVAIGGGSAGGALAAGVALRMRDGGNSRLVHQFLVYPCLDDRHITPSSREFTDARTWSRDRSLTAWARYLAGRPADEYAAPARAPDLSGTPPTYLVVGQLDLLRDECIDYAQRLMRAGVATTLKVVAGAFHGIVHLAADSSLTARLVDEVCFEIATALRS